MRNWFHTIFQNLQHAILYSATNVSSALLFFRCASISWFQVVTQSVSDVFRLAHLRVFQSYSGQGPIFTSPGLVAWLDWFMFYEVECWYTIDFNSRDQIHWILPNTTRLMGFNTKKLRMVVKVPQPGIHRRCWFYLIYLLGVRAHLLTEDLGPPLPSASVDVDNL